MSKTHHSRSGDPNDGITTCGITPNTMSATDRGEVTCKECIRRLDAAEPALPRDRRGDHAPAVHHSPQPGLSAAARRIVRRSIAGEPIDDGNPWASWKAWLRAWAMTAAEKRSVHSGSDFGGSGGGRAARVPTTPAGTQTKLLDGEKAFARGLASLTEAERTIRDRVFTADEIRQLAIEDVCGGVLVLPTAPVVGGLRARLYDEIPKGQRVKRGTYTTIEPIPRDVTAKKWGITPHEVSVLVGRAGRPTEADMVRKGLVRVPLVVAKERSERGQEDSMANAHGYDLESWKDIAPVLNRSEDTCKRLASRETDPLPIRRFLGRVVARRKEIEEWAARQVDAA